MGWEGAGSGNGLGRVKVILDRRAAVGFMGAWAITSLPRRKRNKYLRTRLHWRKSGRLHRSISGELGGKNA